MDYLKQYKELNEKINTTIEKKEMWQARTEKTTPTWSDMPKGSDGENPRELAICEMMDCEREVNQLIDQLNSLRRQVRKHITDTGDKNIELLEILHIEK